MYGVQQGVENMTFCLCTTVYGWPLMKKRLDLGTLWAEGSISEKFKRLALFQG